MYSIRMGNEAELWLHGFGKGCGEVRVVCDEEHALVFLSLNDAMHAAQSPLLLALGKPTLVRSRAFDR